MTRSERDGDRLATFEEGWAMATQERVACDLARMAEAHGMRAVAVSGTVHVSIPWTHVSGEYGVDVYVVTTWRELRQALGY